jgi:hypothetical protein
MKKLKNKIDVSKLSFSVPWRMEALIKERAAGMDMTMSQYIRRLIKDDINQAQVSPQNVVSTECEDDNR